MKKLKSGSSQLSLPLWSRVVFCDWNGVLSRDVFWKSIRQNNKHPFHQRLNVACNAFFEAELQTVRKWMRGSIGSKDVVAAMDVCLDKRCNDDYLLRRLKEDCRRMSCNVRLLNELKTIRRDSFVVLATDNMDCFLEQLPKLSDVFDVFDDVLCSSELGVLKSDSVDRFFGPWLRRNKLEFQQAILIDDCSDTCRQFEMMGGKAILVDSINEAIDELRTTAEIYTDSG